MRTRAFRPEIGDCLENRSLLSGVADLSANPVVFPHRRLDFIAERMRNGFDGFGRYHDASEIYSDIDYVIVMVPFARVDRLGVTIHRIVRGMEHDLAAHVPHAVRTALTDVIAATRAEIASRVHAGDVVVR